mmetsp:Transcript_62206/g.151690  ORF Transcript_62206/g.151690 Transcript_62206/m.151690 type:complete len:250 (-) Transcript_62206:501-1250(-)
MSQKEGLCRHRSSRSTPTWLDSRLGSAPSAKFFRWSTKSALDSVRKMRSAMSTVTVRPVKYVQVPYVSTFQNRICAAGKVRNVMVPRTDVTRRQTSASNAQMKNTVIPTRFAITTNALSAKTTTTATKTKCAQAKMNVSSVKTTTTVTTNHGQLISTRSINGSVSKRNVKNVPRTRTVKTTTTFQMKTRMSVMTMNVLNARKTSIVHSSLTRPSATKTNASNAKKPPTATQVFLKDAWITSVLFKSRSQ